LKLGEATLFEVESRGRLEGASKSRAKTWWGPKELQNFRDILSALKAISQEVILLHSFHYKWGKNEKKTQNLVIFGLKYKLSL
jgi:hypothetical protein